LKSIWIGLLAMLGAAASAQPSPQAGAETTWYVIMADDGARLGHVSVEVVARRDGGRDFVEDQAFYIREQGAAPTRIAIRTVRSEDSAGNTVSINSTSQSGRFRAHAEARISEGSAEIVRETPSGRATVVVVLPAQVRFDDGEGLLRGWDVVAAPRLEFDYFNIDAMGVERVVVEAAPDGAPDREGRISAVRRRYLDDGLTGIARVTLDRAGRIVEIAQPMFGATIHLRATSREAALQPHPPYRIVPNFMTRSPFRISPSASLGHIRFHLGFKDGLEFALPQTGEQRAITASGVAIVDVCDDCGPGMPSDPETLADAMRSTTWMQSDDPRIREIVAPIARMDVSDTRKMELLSALARPYFERMDYTGHYSALDMMARRAGDCTEAAVLVAAFGRAVGIPTRIASGLAYSRESYHGVSNAFMPHSWTLAWVDGQWRSFDMALEQFDSTHIVLTIGDGDARSIAAAGQLASLVRFDGIAEVRAGP
jgi:Transglutaminase-like superfamily